MTAPWLADNHKIAQRIFSLPVGNVLDINLISVGNVLGFI
jgi:hypothetical protein